MSLKEAANAFSKVLERKVRYINLPKFAYRVSLLAIGVDRWLTKGLVAQLGGLVAGGYDIAATQDVETLTGKPPRTLESFIAENRSRLDAR